MTRTDPYAEERYFLQGMAVTFLIVAVLIVDIVLGFAWSDQIMALWDRISIVPEFIKDDIRQIEQWSGR